MVLFTVGIIIRKEYCDVYAVGLRDKESQQRKNALLGNG
jgi:hypothetical protein